MNIAVIGIGGVGGYFGAKLGRLAESGSGLHVSFVARGMHLREIQKNGLLVDADEGKIVCMPSLATGKIDEIPVPDLCMICVKSFDLQDVILQLASKISDRTVIMPLLNGVDIYERVRALIKNGAVFPACVYIGTHLEKPGMVVQRGGACAINFGKDPVTGYMDSRVPGLFDRAGIKYRLLENPYTEIWSKYIFIAAYGLVTAYSGNSIGQVLASGELSDIVRSIINEVVAIARAKGVPLPDSIAGDSFAKGESFPYETKTSFQRDYESNDKLDERDLFGGAIIRMGHELGITVPVTGSIYAELERKKPIA